MWLYFVSHNPLLASISHTTNISHFLFTWLTFLDPHCSHTDLECSRIASQISDSKSSKLRSSLKKDGAKLRLRFLYPNQVSMSNLKIAQSQLPKWGAVLHLRNFIEDFGTVHTFLIFQGKKPLVRPSIMIILYHQNSLKHDIILICFCIPNGAYDHTEILSETHLAWFYRMMSPM